MSCFCAPPTPTPQLAGAHCAPSDVWTGAGVAMFASPAAPAVGGPKPARDAIVSRLERSRPCMSGRAAAQTQRDAAEIGWNGGVGLGGGGVSHAGSGAWQLRAARIPTLAFRLIRLPNR